MTSAENTLNIGSIDLGESFMRAAEEVELVADLLVADIEAWAADYAAALRRKAYALSS